MAQKGKDVVAPDSHSNDLESERKMTENLLLE